MIVIFDLELTAWPGSVQRNWSGPGEYAEIIQIGAVRLDDEMCEIGALDLAVKPRLNPILSDYIVGLTGLTQERVDRDGVSLEAGLARLARFAEGSQALLCNGGDAEWIRHNVGLAKIDNPLGGMSRRRCPRLSASTSPAMPMTVSPTRARYRRPCAGRCPAEASPLCLPR